MSLRMTAMGQLILAVAARQGHAPEPYRFQKCNATQALAYTMLYPREMSPEAVYFRTEALRLLQQAKHVLDGLGLPFWLNSGSLLGYFRQCDIIAHSKDVDLGMFAADFDGRLVLALQAAGLRLTHRFGRPTDRSVTVTPTHVCSTWRAYIASSTYLLLLTHACTHGLAFLVLNFPLKHRVG